MRYRKLPRRPEGIRRGASEITQDIDDEIALRLSMRVESLMREAECARSGGAGGA